MTGGGIQGCQGSGGTRRHSSRLDQIRLGGKKAVKNSTLLGYKSVKPSDKYSYPTERKQTYINFCSTI